MKIYCPKCMSRIKYVSIYVRVRVKHGSPYMFYRIGNTMSGYYTAEKAEKANVIPTYTCPYCDLFLTNELSDIKRLFSEGCKYIEYYNKQGRIVF